MTRPHPPLDGPPRVLVVDSDDRVRESLIGLLAIGGRCTVVASAGAAGEALDLAVARQPDVVIVDPRLPELADGLAFISKLRARRPELSIIAMSWSATLEADVLESGADAFIRKTFRPAELVAAVLDATRPTDLPATGTA